jgi:hypothetical protein
MVHLLAILAASFAAASPSLSEPISPSAVQVIDGDTIRVGRIVYRLGSRIPRQLRARAHFGRARHAAPARAHRGRRP